MLCSHCNAESLPGARFCAACGTALAGPPASSGAASRQPSTKQPERRPITVLFCDLVDSTELSTQLDPEDYHALIAGYQSQAAFQIEHFGGFVAKYMGDGLVAYFGYPAAKEDDAERAVRSGLALARVISGLTSVNGPLKVRIGIASGSVIIGDLIGEGSARESAIAGETPNLAARLQTVANPGEVIISQSTRALVGNLFACEALGDVTLKGFGQPQPAFRAQASRQHLSRFEALRSSTAPIVGRQEELGLLNRCWNRARRGNPQVVLLCADAGVGKSRLIAHFRKQLPSGKHQLRKIYCAPIEENSAFSPIARAVEERCGLMDTDALPVKLHKVEALARDIFTFDAIKAATLLAELLSLDTSHHFPPLTISPQRRLLETTQILAEVILDQAMIRPTLIVIEDIHWLDPSSLDVLRTIVGRLRSGMRLFVIVSHRPQFQPPSGWLGRPNVTALPLTRLGNDDAEMIMRHAAGGSVLEEVTIRRILDHADGVPLFLEEITRAFVEERRNGRQTHAADLTVPATLQASLLARLDRLSAGREIAQIGAAIGRTFSRELVRVVARQTEREIDMALSELIAADLVVTSGTEDAPAFVFRHALIQDIAYGALLRAPRQALHERIAKALIDSFPADVDARPERLAHHHQEAGHGLEAAAAWRRAAAKTLRRGAWNEGYKQLETAVDCLAALKQEQARDRLELDLLMMMGGVAMGALGHSAPQAQNAYRRAYELACALGEMHIAALAGSRLWLAEYGKGDLEGVRASAQRIHAEIGSRCNDVDQALIRSSLTTAYMFEGRFHDAAQALRNTAFIDAVTANDLAPEEYYFMSQSAQTVNSRLVLHLVSARHASWRQTCHEILASLEVIGPVGALIGLTMIIYTGYVAEAWSELPRDLSRFEQMISQIGGADHYLDLAQLVRLRLQARAGQLDSIVPVRTIMEAETVSFAMQHLPRYQMIAGDACADMGDDEEARRYFLSVLEGGPHQSQQWLRSEVLRRLGDLETAKDGERARAYYVQALATARHQGAALFEMRAAMALARLDPVAGLDDLRKACTNPEANGPDVDAGRALLFSLESSAPITDGGRQPSQSRHS